MQITKFGHCCLHMTLGGTSLLTDPGVWSEGFEAVTGIDAVLITHEHPDHFHTESLKKVLEKNPHTLVFTNSSVARLLASEGIACTTVKHGQQFRVKDTDVLTFGEKHAAIYDSIPEVENTGFVIGNRLYYPGDAFTLPPIPVEILALPVAGPWMHMRDALDFAKNIKPKITFPVHDGFLKFGGPFHAVPARILQPLGIDFLPLEAGTKYNF